MIHRSENEFHGVGLLVYFFAYSLVINTAGIVATAKLENTYLGVMVGGCVIGELCMMAIWATIGPNRFWVRWPMVFFMIVIGANAIIFTVILSSGTNFGTDLYEALRVNFVLPLVLLAAQAPIWLGRIVLGWRIRQPQGKTLEQERRFGILEILMVMSYFGGALALARFTMAEDQGAQSITVAFILSVYASMWMLMFAIPLLMGVLLPTHTRGTLAVLVSYFSFMLLVPMTAVWFLAGSFSMDFIGSLLLFLAGNAITFVAFALILKGFGYALEIRLGKTSNIVESPFDFQGDSPFANPWETPSAGFETDQHGSSTDPKQVDPSSPSSAESDASGVDALDEKPLTRDPSDDVSPGRSAEQE